MGTGYTRNDTANNIADGNVINASDLDGEFDAIQSAFNGSTGHSHDGTTGEGPQIGTAGIANDAVTSDKIATGAVVADGIANNAVALGTKTTGNYVATITAGEGIDVSGSGTETAAVTISAEDASTTNKGVASFNSSDFSVSSGAVSLAKDPVITLSGDVSGSATMTNLGSATITTTVANDSHTHDGRYFTETESDARYCLEANNLSDLTNAATARTNLGLGSLATLSTVNAATITDNSVGAAELNVSGNGTTSQFLRSDGDGTFTWATPTDTNTTYSAGSGLDLSGTTFSVESDLRGDVVYIGQDTNDFYVVTATAHDWYLDGNLDMRLENDGDLHVDGDVIAYSTTTSDPRLKDNIKKVEGALDMVDKLTGYTFTYKVDGRESAGVMSTEVKEVLPSAVRSTTLPLKSPNGEDDNTEYDVVQYDQLHAVLIEAIKELRAEVEALKGVK